jgi:hypothetical protein
MVICVDGVQSRIEPSISARETRRLLAGVLVQRVLNEHLSTRTDARRQVNRQASNPTRIDVPEAAGPSSRQRIFPLGTKLSGLARISARTTMPKHGEKDNKPLVVFGHEIRPRLTNAALPRERMPSIDRESDQQAKRFQAIEAAKSSRSTSYDVGKGYHLV